jgi:hypothetical protein
MSNPEKFSDTFQHIDRRVLDELARITSTAHVVWSDSVGRIVEYAGWRKHNSPVAADLTDALAKAEPYIGWVIEPNRGLRRLPADELLADDAAQGGELGAKRLAPGLCQSVSKRARGSGVLAERERDRCIRRALARNCAKLMANPSKYRTSIGLFDDRVRSELERVATGTRLVWAGSVKTFLDYADWRGRGDYAPSVPPELTRAADSARPFVSMLLLVPGGTARARV